MDWECLEAQRTVYSELGQYLAFHSVWYIPNTDLVVESEFKT